VKSVRTFILGVVATLALITHLAWGTVSTDSTKTGIGSGATPAGSSGQVQYNNASALGAAPLWVESANVLAQRNSTNAQSLFVYNTYTDASNYERGFLQWDTNSLRIGADAAGTGSKRQSIVEGNTISFRPLSGSIGIVWQMSNTGHLTTPTTNTYDIGASGGTRPRTVYAATSVVAPYQQTTATTVGALTACNAGAQGTRSMVTDASATTFASTVAGGGANIMPVICNGTNWIIG
jgi:hypothetical protein